MLIDRYFRTHPKRFHTLAFKIKTVARRLLHVPVHRSCAIAYLFSVTSLIIDLQIKSARNHVITNDRESVLLPCVSQRRNRFETIVLCSKLSFLNLKVTLPRQSEPPRVIHIRNVRRVQKPDGNAAKHHRNTI